MKLQLRGFPKSSLSLSADCKREERTCCENVLDVTVKRMGKKDMPIFLLIKNDRLIDVEQQGTLDAI